MSVSRFLLLGTLCASIAMAGEDDIKPPPTREGLWETHSKQTEQGKTVSDRSVRMCQSKQITQAMQARGERMRKQNECTTHLSKPSANTYIEESRCAKGPSAGTATKVIYTNEGDTASHTEMHLDAGGSQTLVIIDAKYLGACPAGMKPGDLMMEDGKIISGATDD